MGFRNPSYIYSMEVRHVTSKRNHFVIAILKLFFCSRMIMKQSSELRRIHISIQALYLAKLLEYNLLKQADLAEAVIRALCNLSAFHPSTSHWIYYQFSSECGNQQPWIWSCFISSWSLSFFLSPNGAWSQCSFPSTNQHVQKLNTAKLSESITSHQRAIAMEIELDTP